MRHSKAKNIVLLGSCSYCYEIFQTGAARLINGDYPLEQFCSNKCAEEFLKTAGEDSHSSRPSSSLEGKNSLERPGQQ